jgi:hypothetical protein
MKKSNLLGRNLMVKLEEKNQENDQVLSFCF